MPDPELYVCSREESRHCYQNVQTLYVNPHAGRLKSITFSSLKGYTQYV